MFEAFKVDRKNISDTVVEFIKDLIHEGKIKPGDRMPGERELAQQMNVSRNTIREAYKILAAQAYLNIKHGNGVFIADEDTQIHQLTSSFFVKNDQIIELFAIRKVLETQAIEWAVDHLHKEDEIELLNILKDTRAALKQRSYDELAQLDHKFHLTLMRMSRNTVLFRIMLNLIDLLSEARSASIHIPDRAEQSLKEHSRIVEFILAEEVEAAKQSMLEHLNSVEKSIVMKKTNRTVSDL